MFSSFNLILEGLTFGLVVLLSILAFRAAEGWLAVRRRLASGTVVRAAASDRPLMKKETVRNGFLVWFQSATSNSADRLKLRGDLAAAGFDHPAGPAIYEL